MTENLHFVEKPIARSPLRKRFGKLYFIYKRRFDWVFNNKRYAQRTASLENSCLVKEHRSFLLRPLKNVDMVLQYNKVKNLELAIQPINGVLIHPGETFSIWKLVGKPTAAKGYLPGLALDSGNIKSDVGGGLCQLGNLLYWLFLHSPLTISERWRHGYDVFPDINRTIPFACGATLSYNYIDLQVLNNTEWVFQLKLWLDKEYLNGALYADSELQHTYQVRETDHLMKLQWWGGYTRHNRIWRHKFDLAGNELSTELVAENHAIMMYNPLLEK